METPIFDFVTKYSESNAVRMHMPGHKGKSLLGIEHLDITEIKGADSLYEADGIIAQSEGNASALFGCDTFYSAEGSSLCIRAMLYLVSQYAKENAKSNIILAGRNAHKTFINTVALLDLDVEWLSPSENDSYLSFTVDPKKLDEALSKAKTKPVAVYVTSPDYLGCISDVKEISRICKKHGVLLLVDNAHGAYLRFLPKSMLPTDLGADLCCSSAHKTLPVLTGGAYLHVAKNTSALFKNNARKALSLFGSTSPSYVILQSLDKANEYIENGYADALAKTAEKISELKQSLTDKGYTLLGNEPMKITVEAKKYGYTGIELGDLMRRYNLECEFADPDHTVFMLSPENTTAQLNVLKNGLLSLPRKSEITHKPPALSLPQRAMTVRQATLSPCETVKVKDSLGRILAFAQVGCPPAVPIVVSGEIIDENAIEVFEYYGINECCAVKE